MYFCVTILLLIKLSASQNDYEEESLQMMTNIVTTSSNVICKTCACEDGDVDCSELNIREPFDQEDWNGLKDFAPISVDLSNNPICSLKRLPELPIRNLNFSNCDISKIDGGCFMFLPNLTSLDLSYNRISTSVLGKRIFLPKIFADREPEHFSNLRYVSLAYNEIHSLPQNLFAFMTELHTLDLSGNPLAYIDQLTMAALSDLIVLKTLKLSECELETLPEGLLRRQRSLQNLDLSNNRFSTIPAVLNEAINLVYLKFDKNPITAMEEKTPISNLTKLKELHICRMSKLKTIGAGALGGLKSLVKIHLCYNPRLTTIHEDFLAWQDDDEVERWPSLKMLYMNNNNLSEIKAHFLDRWDQLIEADFSENPYICGCNVEWMVEVLVPLINSTRSSGTLANMVCKKPTDVRGMTIAQMQHKVRHLHCKDIKEQPTEQVSDMAVVLGIMIGIFVTFPIVTVIMLLWKKGVFAKCRGEPDRTEGYKYEETEPYNFKL